MTEPEWIWSAPIELDLEKFVRICRWCDDHCGQQLQEWTNKHADEVPSQSISHSYVRWGFLTKEKLVEFILVWL